MVSHSLKIGVHIPSLSITFSDNTIDAMCRYIIDWQLVSSEDWLVTFSIVEFARPAVVFSFLLQVILTHAVFNAIWPPVTLLSSSNRKSSASLCFTSSDIRSLLVCMGLVDVSDCKPFMLNSKL